MDDLREVLVASGLVGCVAVDALPWTAGALGLFSGGEKRLGRWVDMLGNVTERRQRTVTVAVCLEKAPGVDASQNLRFMEALAAYINENCPVYGEEQTHFCGGVRLRSADETGLARYEAVLTVDYTRIGGKSRAKQLLELNGKRFSICRKLSEKAWEFTPGTRKLRLLNGDTAVFVTGYEPKLRLSCEAGDGIFEELIAAVKRAPAPLKAALVTVKDGTERRQEGYIELLRLGETLEFCLHLTLKTAGVCYEAL